MNDLCTVISNAKCCAARMGAKYVDMLTYGEVTEEFRYKWLDLQTYINALERYDQQPQKKEWVGTELYDGDTALELNGKQLHINVHCRKVKGCPCNNCVGQDELCDIIEQVKLICGDCGCNDC